MAILVIPWIALFFPFVLLVLFVLYKHSISATKEVNRILSVTKSPLLSFQQEILSGSSTIRAYNKREQFMESSYKFMNDNIVATQYAEGVPLWFAIRLDIVALLTMGIIALFCVLTRNEQNTVVLAILLTYALTVQSSTNMSIKTIMTLEAKFVNV